MGKANQGMKTWNCMRDLIWKRADQGMKTWKKILTGSSISSNPQSVKNLTGTASVQCAGWESEGQGQKQEKPVGEVWPTKKKSECNLIWTRADQGMKTWRKNLCSSLVTIPEEPEPVHWELETAKRDGEKEKKTKKAVVKDKAFYPNLLQQSKTKDKDCDENKNTSKSKVYKEGETSISTSSVQCAGWEMEHAKTKKNKVSISTYRQVYLNT